MYAAIADRTLFEARRLLCFVTEFCLGTHSQAAGRMSAKYV
jgi:hypothetical protein